MSDRTSRIFRVGELMLRYRPEQDGKVWRFRDTETGDLSTATYPDEAMARDGARMQSACDIDQLYDTAGGR